MATTGTNRGPEILGWCLTLIGIALLFVSTRVWVRATEMKRFWIDDYVMIGAAMVMLIQMILIILQVRLGAGQHVHDIDPEDNIDGLRLNFVTQPLCLIALFLVKASIGLLLLRLTASAKFKRFIWAVIVFTLAAFLGNLLTVMLQCQPLTLVWNMSAEGTCMPASKLKFAAFFNSSVSVVTDLVFVILPAVLLWRIQISRRKKMFVIPVLSLGFFATIAGIIKMLFLEDYGRAGDFLYDSSSITIWTTVEICLAMIAACAHTLRTMFRATFTNRTTASGQRVYRSEERTNPTAPRTTCVAEPDNLEMDNIAVQGRARSLSAESQESIISHAETREARITKTTDFEVKMSDGSLPEARSHGRPLYYDF